MTLRDDILARYSPAPAKVQALDGLDVWAKALSGADWFDLLACESGADRLVLAVARGACDAKGARIFGDEDMPRIRSLSREFTSPVSDLVLKLSGVEGDEGKAVSAPGGVSPSV